MDDVRSPIQQALQGGLRGRTSPDRARSGPGRETTKVVLDELLFSSGYRSCYSKDIIGQEKLERLYICRSCFRYTAKLSPYRGHLKLCPYRTQPPGKCVYRKDQYSIYEVDGADEKLFCQNLSLFARMFIGNKALCFDVSSFNFYILVYTDVQPQLASGSEEQQQQRATHQVIGYFSKEKLSWDNNNVACILVFPPWQKKGLGKILMAASYELARRTGLMGGPERPFSEAGRRAYISFWSATVARHILSCPSRQAISVRSISNATWILPDDVIVALKHMDIVNPKQSVKGKIVIKKSKVREWASRHRVGRESPVDSKAFIDVLETGERGVAEEAANNINIG
ncbi:MAG: hypothetical protein M1816_003849 [Peltula sp. TS41687]|nr:MAG: hypothetical protein M1816_003849 [Peltula sp. TS41687]